MAKSGRRKCLHCNKLFRPDPRNVRHQRYCSEADCRRASKAASQRRWLAKAENRDYFRGADQVARVRAWRAANPDYSRKGRKRSRQEAALQEDLFSQPTDSIEENGGSAGTALQDVLSSQPLVLIGLIAHLTGSALQEDIAASARRFEQLALDIYDGVQDPNGSKTTAHPSANAPPADPVQLA